MRAARAARRPARPVASATSTPTPSPRRPTGPPPRTPEENAALAIIDARPVSRLVRALFRAKMAAAVGEDSQLDGYDAIIDLTRRLNARPPAATAAATLTILRSLFPSWLPPAFAVLFSRPFPRFAARINAEATALACEWLMGPCTVDGGGEDGLGGRTGVRVTRCRYLEETGCASACVNSCKLPTQAFFERDMGLALRMTPDLETYECQFSFGVPAEKWRDDPMATTPCFEGGCPSPKAGGCGGAVCPGVAGASDEF